LPQNDRAAQLPDKESDMGLMDGLLGGAVGAGMVTAVNSLLEQHGGLQGLIAQFEKQGLAGTVRSWVSNEPNQAISPDQVHQVFGSDTISKLAAKVGMNPQDLAQKLSHVLPQAIDKLTPDGQVPPRSA